LSPKPRTREEDRTAKKKTAQKRLSLLQLAEKLRKVSEACRHFGVSRSQFYEYKRAFQERGFEGLIDRPPMPKTFPNETRPEVKEKVISLSLDHPAWWGPVHIRYHLSLEAVRVSPSTVLDEFFRETFRSKFWGSVEELQQDLDQWLQYYNYERPHQRDRNVGGRSIETIEVERLVKEQAMKKAA
jgi:hypothetical protein